jgi:hypothetical protein
VGHEAGRFGSAIPDKEKAARRRPLNSKLVIVDQTAVNVGFYSWRRSRAARFRILIG